MISLPDGHHIYANDKIVSFLYDRPECRSANGPFNRTCDVILLEFSDSGDSYIWLIECKSNVTRSTASTAAEQIESCLRVIKNARGWKIMKCIIADSFGHDTKKFLT